MNCETDIRLCIDYNKFKAANPTEKKKIFIDRLLFSLDELQRKRVPMDYEKMKIDLTPLKESMKS